MTRIIRTLPLPRCYCCILSQKRRPVCKRWATCAYNTLHSARFSSDYAI